MTCLLIESLIVTCICASWPYWGLQSASGALMVTWSPTLALDGFTEYAGGPQGGSAFGGDATHPGIEPTTKTALTASSIEGRRPGSKTQSLRRVAISPLLAVWAQV